MVVYLSCSLQMKMLVILMALMTFQSTISYSPCRSNYCPPIPEKERIIVGREFPLKNVGFVEHGCHCRQHLNIYTICFNFKDRAIPCQRFPTNVKVLTSILILKSTFITEIVRGDFDNLKNVEDMTIDGNQKLLNIQPFVFQNMTKLTTLSFIFNPSLLSLHPDTFQGLVNLKELNLVKNGLHSIQQLSVTLKANILPKLYKLNLNENVFKNISEFDFQPMEGSSLEELNMILCGIEHIHPRSLKPLKKLAALRIGENRIDFDLLFDMLHESLDIGIDLQLLDLSSSGFRTYKHRSLFEIVAKSNISSLILARNQFDVLDNETFPFFMPNLISLDLTDVSAQSINDQAFTNLPNLRTLILAKNKLSFFGASKQLPKLTYLDLESNTDVFGGEFFLTRSEFKEMRLEYLSLENTRLILLIRTDFGNLPHLRILNLKKCDILKIENHTLEGLQKLKVLNLEDNRIFRTWEMFHLEMFKGLGNLEEIFLGGNDITTLTTTSGYLLKHLVNLKYLGLRKNSIQRISHRDFATLKQLRVVDISENYLLAWDSRVFLNNNIEKLDVSVNKIAYLSGAMLRDFQNLTYIKSIIIRLFVTVESKMRWVQIK
ncbi:hypothetical protein HHI36_014045 [Cryptolaemus montrouzieri]|uniref:Uncharacterized protein n=1 Tax=Cryptolaemus montrouzieri TaxID=559131 RepID=A0ABD2N1P5_9CUCU